VKNEQEIAQAKKEHLLAKMRVQAISRGYYNNKIREQGDMFRVNRQHFSTNWMVAINKKGEVLEEQPVKIPASTVKEIWALASGETEEDIEKTKRDNNAKIEAEFSSDTGTIAGKIEEAPVVPIEKNPDVTEDEVDLTGAGVQVKTGLQEEKPGIANLM